MVALTVAAMTSNRNRSLHSIETLKCNKVKSSEQRCDPETSSTCATETTSSYLARSHLRFWTLTKHGFSESTKLWYPNQNGGVSRDLGRNGRQMLTRPAGRSRR